MNRARLGNCYELAGGAVAGLKFGPGAVLVHGTIGPKKNPHAWVEIAGEPVYLMIPAEGPNRTKRLVYDGVEVWEHSRYTVRETNEHCLRDEHWGPWDATGKE